MYLYSAGPDSHMSRAEHRGCFSALLRSCADELLDALIPGSWLLGHGLVRCGLGLWIRGCVPTIAKTIVSGRSCVWG